MSTPFRVKALHAYTSDYEDDLSFSIGQIITVTKEEDEEWYEGEYVDDSGVKKDGIFPRNFVEKFEPTAPPRPTRSRPKKEPETTHAPKEAVTSSVPPPSTAIGTRDATEKAEEAKEAAVPTTGDAKADEPVTSDRPVPPAPIPVATNPPTEADMTPRSPTAAVSPPAAKAAPAAATKPKPAPPPVSDKPASNSFKDRIAAFNKPAAPPIAPFKPGGLSSGGSASGTSSNFIKKPFVPPPPSRDAYVPVAKEKPTAAAYRRDEDPEIKEREAEIQEQAEKAGLVPSEQQEEVQEEDQPKPTSLKERIALLQRQQLEQAQRHAEAAAKKEKPKKPAKKRSEDAPAEGAEGPLSPPLERSETHDAEQRTSMDDAGSRAMPPPRRKASKGPAVDESHDGNEADMSGAGDTTEGQDDTTEREDNEELSHRVSRVPTSSTATGIAAPSYAGDEAEQENDEEAGEEEGEEEEDEVDPEVKRKEELRARMAKMSGGMGFHGMFGAPMPPASAKPPPKKKPAKSAEQGTAVDEPEQSTSRAAPPVPTPMALPGMGGAQTGGRADRREEVDDSDDEEEEPATRVPSRPVPPPVPARTADPRDQDSEEDEDEDATTPAARPEPSFTRRVPSGPPPIPGGRPLPPPVPTESRAPPPPPPGEAKAPTEGSESDDELSGNARESGLDRIASQVKRSPPMPPQPAQAQAPSMPPRSPPLSPHGEDVSTSSSPTSNKRASRPPPPVPSSAPAPPPASSRPPPPPPPGGLSRQSTADMNVPTPTRPPQAGEDGDEEITEYEGDYDTDIGSSVPHKDALKSHARDSSLEDNSLQSPTRDAPPGAPPPIPGASGPRGVPPPIPMHLPMESKRRSTDAPRGAPPPPPPPSKETSTVGEGGDYDPYNYAASPPVPPMGSSYGPKTPKIDEEGAYFSSPSAPVATPPPVERRAAPPGPPPGRPGNRASTDLPRTSTSNRRSLDAHRPSVESGFIANDIDLSAQSGWWKQAAQVPPVLQRRKDIHFEFEESTTTNQGSKTVVTRDIYVLYQDYSQTVVTVRYDPYDPSDAALDQRHEPPPRPLRQDEMEEFYERFGRQIAETASAKKDTVVGEGAPQSLVWELFKPLKGALAPVGTRAYGALVYANMANASTQQQDVIRAGDIISFRNAKFQGKHGPMHAKYSAEVGKPDHVAVVAEWDGTKKKVRAWEQGRENKKVKQESYKLDDLRSGEVKIWRVVPRSWVGWNIQP